MTTTISTGGSSGQVRAITAIAIRDRMTLSALVATLLVGLGALTGSLWPSLNGTFADLPASVRDNFDKILAGADLTTPAGWMNAETVSLMAPAAAIAVAVISGVRAVAGEEEDKTLGVLLSTPVSRASFLIAKSVAMAVHVLVVVVGLGLGIVVGSMIGDLNISPSGVVGACLHVGLLGVSFGAVAILASALTGDRRVSVAASAGLAGLAFAVSSFLPLSDSLAEGARFSPWYYFSDNDPLLNGPQPINLVVLAMISVALLAIAMRIYARRDLRG